MTEGRSTHTVPERDADPTRGLVPPTTRTPEVDDGKELTATRKAGAGSIFSGPLIRAAIGESFRKLDPRLVAKNPVMFVVEVGAAITTIVLLQQIVTASGNIGFTLQITLWLWFTVLFANFAEAMAEARGKAQADTLRATKKETPARRLRDGREEMVSSSDLRKGDIVLVREGETMPGDGEVVEGVARTIVFLLAVATLEPFAICAGTTVSSVILIALLVCLIPTTIGGLLSATGIGGMDRV